MNATDQTTLATCEICSGTFERPMSELWKRKCFGCWKRSKATEAAPPTDPYRAGYSAGFAAGSRIAAPASPSIDKDRLRALIRLCHPDLHDGSKLATETTAWLLSLRKEVERC